MSQEFRNRVKRGLKSTKLEPTSPSQQKLKEIYTQKAWELEFPEDYPVSSTEIQQFLDHLPTDHPYLRYISKLHADRLIKFSNIRTLLIETLQPWNIPLSLQRSWKEKQQSLDSFDSIFRYIISRPRVVEIIDLIYGFESVFSPFTGDGKLKQLETEVNYIPICQKMYYLEKLIEFNVLVQYTPITNLISTGFQLREKLHPRLHINR